MTTKTIRKMVLIDEDKCNGCGICIPSCAEGALQIIDGKAKLIDEKFCDGLGACLGECPMDAISVVDQLADEFDEALVEEYLAEQKAHHHAEEDTLACGCPSSTVTQFEDLGAVPGGCPGSRMAAFGAATTAAAPGARQVSTLAHWPVQMTLVPPTAPFLQGTDLALTADCVPFTYANFHEDFIKDHSLIIACPKLDDAQAHLEKLTAILTASDIKSLSVIHMEVPCCSGLVHMARQAIAASGKDIPLREVTIGIRGEVLD